MKRKRSLGGKAFFEALGQRARATQVTWFAVRKPFAPMWVRRAIARGHMGQGFSVRVKT